MEFANSFIDNLLIEYMTYFPTRESLRFLVAGFEAPAGNTTGCVSDNGNVEIVRVQSCLIKAV